MAKKQRKSVNGLDCRARSFKRNVLFYKDIGGKLRIWERRSTIRSRTVEVYLQNRYYMKDEFAMGASAQLVEFLPPIEGSRVTFKKWRHKHYAWGFGVKLTAGHLVPTTGVPGMLPLVGVQTETTVVVEHNGITRREVFVTQRGSVPDTPRMLIPRIGTSPISTRTIVQHHPAPAGSISVRQSFASAGALVDQTVRSAREGLFALARPR